MSMHLGKLFCFSLNFNEIRWYCSSTHRYTTTLIKFHQNPMKNKKSFTKGEILERGNFFRTRPNFFIFQEPKRDQHWCCHPDYVHTTIVIIANDKNVSFYRLVWKNGTRSRMTLIFWLLTLLQWVMAIFVALVFEPDAWNS